MNLSQLMPRVLLSRFRRQTGVWLMVAFWSFSVCGGVAEAQPENSTQTSVTADEYVSKIKFFDQLISVCQAKPSPNNCRSSQVGPDLTVVFPSGKRAVRFEWLRQLMDNAAKGDSTKSPNISKTAMQAKNPPAPVSGPVVLPSASPEHRFQPPSIVTQLQDARGRLSAEAESAKRLSAVAQQQGSLGETSERRVLARILAAKEYQGIHQGPSLIQQIKERVGNWINRFIGKLIRAGAHSKWIGITAEITFVVLLCVALVWLLIRIERQGRMGPVSIGTAPGEGAASARDWQLWLEDARKAAALGAWRDAIHLLYWASISRLESTGHWPADRARTPREYLALLGPQSQYHGSLVTLTHSFERAWYAGRPTAESDYREAEQLSLQLGLSGRFISGAR
jgi:hypothetical protein